MFLHYLSLALEGQMRFLLPLAGRQTVTLGHLPEIHAGTTGTGAIILN